ncbi:putative glucanase [Aspergillus heterothallicus]
MSTGILRVDGSQVVDRNGSQVRLRGVGLGGWLNLENFINGFCGNEKETRQAMLDSMGKDNYDFFFDRLMEYFFTEEDAQYLKSLGLNCLRLPFNYRHFENDMAPRVLIEDGFKHLDRVIELCAAHGIYTILDLHSLPGGQNQDWHCDNITAYASFWDHKDFQDRAVWLWEHMARRYKSNPWVAGYNIMNEPSDPQGTRLVSFYNRIEKAIREIDPDHILWLEGNMYAMDFEAFTDPLPNCVYAIHDYSTMGFPDGPMFTGTAEQKERLRKQFLRKCDFMMKHKLPIWNGEFGPTYARPSDSNASEINEARLGLLAEQVRIYEEANISWALWTYKDVGLMGMLHTSPGSAWNRLTDDFVAKKECLRLDSSPSFTNDEIDTVLLPLVKWVQDTCPRASKTYPKVWGIRRHIERQVFHVFLAHQYCEEFASLFQGKSKEELDELARSFSFSECTQRENLDKVLGRAMMI